ncbi:MAG: carbohydrate ABC transporter permease [Anaerolineae bacterium]
MRKKNWVIQVFIYLFLLVWVFFSMLPLFWTVLSSIKVPIDAFSRVPKIFNFTPTGDNYAKLWLKGPSEDFLPFGIGILVILVFLAILAANAERVSPGRRRSKAGPYLLVVAVVLGIIFLLPNFFMMAEFYSYFQNSIVVALGVVSISITIGCLAGYGLARYAGVLGVIILVVALAFRALPGSAFVLPYFYLGRLSGLYDTYFLLIVALVAVNQPFTIWLLRSFFMEIPREIEEAAMIDGAGRLQAFVRVIIPIMWPGIITTALFSLLLAYSDFFFALMLTLTRWTLPVGIVQFTGGEDPGYVTVAAAASVSISIPIIFVIIFFQKYLIKGLGAGAVKG